MGHRSLTLIVTLTCVAGLLSSPRASQAESPRNPSADERVLDLLTSAATDVDLTRVRELARDHPGVVAAYLAARKPTYPIRDLLLAPEPVVTAYAIHQAASDARVCEEMIRIVADIPYGQQPLMTKIFASVTRMNGGAGGPVLLRGYASQLLHEKHDEGFEAMLHYVTIGELAGDDSDSPLLHGLIHWRSFDNARWLLGKGARLHTGDSPAGNTLVLVVYANEPAFLNEILARRSWPVAAIDDAVVAAATHNRPRMVEALVARGARRDALSSHGESAIAMAVSREHIDVVRQLLCLGFNPRIKDKHGHDAFDWARIKKNEEILRLLETSQKEKAKE